MNGAGLGAPSWCPPSSFLRDHPSPDPCAITYKVDIPILGESDVKIPINQIINDIRLQLNQEMPGIIDNVWNQARPKIEQLVVDIQEELTRVAPDITNDLIRQTVMPLVYAEIEKLLAEVDVMVGNVTKVMLGVGGAIVLSVGIAAWWLKS